MQVLSYHQKRGVAKCLLKQLKNFLGLYVAEVVIRKVFLLKESL